MHLRHKVNVVGAILPKDINGALQNGQWISLKGYRWLTIQINQGAWAGGTPAVTLAQAQNVTGLNVKPLGFTMRYQYVYATGVMTEAAVVNNTFTLPATPNLIHLLEIDAATLDSDNGFDCVRLEIGTPGVFADLLSATYLLSEPRYSDNQMPSPLVN